MSSNLKLKLISLIVLSLIIFMIIPENESLAGTDDSPGKRSLDSIWPMFRGDLQHTGRSLYSVYGNPGKLLWRYKTGGMVRSSPSIDVDGTIYVGSDDGYLYALYRSGELRWRFRTGAPVHSSPAIYSDMIVFGSDDGYLYAISKNGTLKWRYKTGGAIWSSPAIYSDMIVFGSDDGYLYAIDVRGNLVWSFRSGSTIRSSPAVSQDGNIYFGSDALYSLFPNGTLRWEFSVGYDFQASPAISSDGTIYIGCMDGKIYAINPSGEEIWKYSTDDAISSSPAISYDGTVYAASRDGHLYAISPNGELKWKKSLSAAVWWSSPTISADGLVVIGNYRGELLVLSSDGELIWKYSVGPIWSSPSIGAEGVIYFGSSDGYIYAIWKGKPSPPIDVKAVYSSDIVNISWKPPIDDGGTPVIKYEIYRGTSPGKEEYIAAVGGWRTYYIDNVENGEIYYYYIIALNDIGKSQKSAEIRAEAGREPFPPAFLKFKIEKGIVNISWEPPPENGGLPIKEYRIYRGEKSGIESYIGSTHRTFFLDRNVSYGKTYYYYVKAVNDMGESGRSEEIVVYLNKKTGIWWYFIIVGIPISIAIIWIKKKRLF